MTSSSSARPPVPLLAVVGGPTGAGKSTLVNSLVRAPVSSAGVLRPTTRTPVLICNPADTARVYRYGLRPIGAPMLPPGIAVIDAPDMDSIEEANRPVAEELFAAADLWLFVITATRYADAAAWRHLEAARARGVALAVVLDRVPVDSAPEIINHLRELLGEPEPPLFVVPESQLDRQGMLSEAVIAPLRDWLAAVVAGPPAEPEWADETETSWGGFLQTDNTEPPIEPEPLVEVEITTEPELLVEAELPTEVELPAEPELLTEAETLVEVELPTGAEPSAEVEEPAADAAAEGDTAGDEAAEGDGERAQVRTRNASGRYVTDRPTRPETAVPQSDDGQPDPTAPDVNTEVTDSETIDGSDSATNATPDGLDDPTPVGETVSGKSRPTPQPVGAGGPSEGPPTDPGGQA